MKVHWKGLFLKQKRIITVVITAALLIQTTAVVSADDHVYEDTSLTVESEAVIDDGFGENDPESYDDTGDKMPESGWEDTTDVDEGTASDNETDALEDRGEAFGDSEVTDSVDDESVSSEEAVNYLESEDAIAAQILQVSPDQDLNGSSYVFPINRIWGFNRYETSRRVVDVYRENAPLNGIILASGSVFADSLSASSLSSVSGYPVLLIDKSSMTTQVDFLKGCLEKGKRVYILGGTSALDGSLEGMLKDYDVKRLAGKNRYGTNLQVLSEIEEYGNDHSQLIVCYGGNFPDAVSCSATGLPIMLSNDSSLTEEQKDYLKQKTYEKITVVGGTSVIKDGLKNLLTAYSKDVERISGSNRYATSVAVAEYFFDKTTVNEVILASGENFPDALSGGALAYKRHAPIIISKRWHEEDGAAYIEKIAPLSALTVLGGESVISNNLILAAAPEALSQNSVDVSQNAKNRYIVTSNYNYDNQYNTLGKYSSYAEALKAVNAQPDSVRYQWYIYDSVNNKVVRNWASSVDRTIQWTRAIAVDARHGYGCIGEQTPDNYKLKYARWGMYGDYSCSTLIAMAYELSGICNMRDIARDNNVRCNYGIGVNFSSLPTILTIAGNKFTNVSGTPTSGLQAGDILLSRSHVAMSLGGGWIVEATMNELNSEFAVPSPGDQTGNEIKFSPDPGGWVYVFRPKR